MGVGGRTIFKVGLKDTFDDADLIDLAGDKIRIN
jgi:hypothetical protein